MSPKLAARDNHLSQDLKQAKGGTWVADIGEIEDIGDDGATFMEIEVVRDPSFT